MDPLHDELAALADEAPTGGAPAAELWARGRQVQRRRAAAAAAATVLVVSVVGAGIGVRLAGGNDDRSAPLPAATAGFTLPIEYPDGEALPDLGDAPGPLAAVWLAPREPYTLDDDDPGQAPQAVGLVAESGTFGTLPIDLSPWVYEAPDARFALSPDGRRIAYFTATQGEGDQADEPVLELVVRDLVGGTEEVPAFTFDIRAGATWVDATRLVGHVAAGSDADGWLWEPGTAPRLVDPHPYLDPPAGTDLPSIYGEPDTNPACVSPTMRDATGRSDVSVLCDVLARIGSEILLGHRYSGDVIDLNDLDQAVIALDVHDAARFPFDDPGLARVVVTRGAPYPVTFATDLIAPALDADGGAS